MCPPATPYCDTSAGHCVQCLTTGDGGSNCPAGPGGAPMICDPTSHSCVECMTDTQCTNRATPHCTTGGSCVACLTNANCTLGRVCSSAGACVQCNTNANCPTDAGTMVCDTMSNTCVAGCTTDTQCTGTARYCSPTLMRCVGCLTNTNCGTFMGTQLVCDTTTGGCVECVMNSDCPTGYACNTGPHFCVPATG